MNNCLEMSTMSVSIISDAETPVTPCKRSAMLDCPVTQPSTPTTAVVGGPGLKRSYAMIFELPPDTPQKGITLVDPVMEESEGCLAAKKVKADDIPGMYQLLYCQHCIPYFIQRRP